MSREGVYAGVDLGASNVRAALADGDGRVVASERRPTPDGPDGDAVAETVRETLRAVCASAGVAPEAVASAGVASVGPLDLAAGSVVAPVNYPASVAEIPLVGPVGDLLGTEAVALLNDATAGVLAERRFGDAPDDVVYLTISSGIGAGVVVDGHVLGGWDGNAGEVGHFVVDATGEQRCGCGRRGHWEAYCAGERLPDYARRLRAEWEGETVLPTEDPDFAAADLFAAADDDPFARSVVERVAEWNALGVADLVHAYAPRVVYVGGAVAVNNPRHVVAPLAARLADLVLTNVPAVRPTTFGEDAVVTGALAAALDAEA